MRLLIIEDSYDLAKWLSRALTQSQYSVDVARDGEEAEHFLAVATYEAVILDLSLPKVDGMTLLLRLRQIGNKTAVLILTANASLDGRVSGLDAGADDHLAKPFDLAELEARLRAIIRRRHDLASAVATVGDLAVNSTTGEFVLKVEPLQLTPRERAVLASLVMRRGSTVKKSALFDDVFGLDADTNASAIEIYVHRVRKKLEGSNVEIATLRGLGYLLRTT